MIIGITLHPYDEEKSSGLGRYILDLTEGLIKNGPENEYVIFLKKQPQKMPKFPGSNWKIEICNRGFFWLNEIISKKTKADVYIFNTPVMPLFHKVPNSIITAFDFAYKHLKAKTFTQYIKNQMLYLYHLYSLKRANHIVATSSSTKDDIIKLFAIPANKIAVIYPGFKKICSLPEKAIEVPENFFFFIGAIKERKNVLNIVKAFVLFKENNDNDYKLVIAGSNKGEYYEQILSYLDAKNRRNDVVFLGYISDEEASYIYKRAKAFVFTTLIEGAMGMPVLEAMDCGLPVITSNTPTFTEFNAGNSAITADPYKPEEIASALKKVVSNEELRKNLIQNGYDFSGKFNWDSIAKEFLKVADGF